MKISIIMPIHNGQRYLAEALNSIVRQTYLPDELIMSDDGSIDRTMEIAKCFRQAAPFDIRIRQIAAGQGITRNYLSALQEASGDTIIVADQDDVWLPGRIEAIVEVFSERPEVALVSLDSKLVDASLRPLGRTLRSISASSKGQVERVNGGEDFIEFLRGIPLLAHTTAVRGSCKESLLDKPAWIEDWWFESWVSHVALCHGRLFLIPALLTLYRQHPKQCAGAPCKVTQIENDTKSYANRVEQLRYSFHLLSMGEHTCLFDNVEKARRMELLQSYIEFLLKRLAIMRQSRGSRFRCGASLLASGSYHRFAHGWRSFGKDMLVEYQD